MQQAIAINPEGSNHLEKLEFVLIKNLELMNHHEFAMICNCISNKQVVFDQFLSNAGDLVFGWLSSDAITNADNLVQICHAFLSRKDTVKTPIRFDEMIELSLLGMADQLDSK